MSIDSIIKNWARTQPDRIALYFPKKGQKYTYAGFEETTVARKQQFTAKGIVPGQVIALLLTDSEQLTLFLITLLRMNACVLPIDLDLDEDKINEIIAFATPAYIITSIGETKLSSIIGKLQVIKSEPFDNTSCLHACTSPIKVGEYGATILLPTSGTTGRPKIVQISLKSIILNARQVCRFLHIGPGDNFLSVTPLVYCHGFYNGVLMPLINGSGTVVIDKFDAFVAARIWAIINQHNLTVVNIVPTMLGMIMKIKYRQTNQVKPLRFMICGTAKLAAKLKLNFTKKFNVSIYTQYGTTEALISTINISSDKPESVGQPIPGCQIVIRDENGHQVSAGEVGEITIKGAFVTLGYFKNAKLTAQVIDGNILKTGDLGYYDQAGFLYVSGRKKEMINKGGMKIFPEDIDRIFRSHPAINEVYTIGVQSNNYGEDIYTFIVLEKNSNISVQMLYEFARSKLSKNKIPREIILLDSIPKGQTGKFKIQDLKSIILAKIKP